MMKPAGYLLRKRAMLFLVILLVIAGSLALTLQVSSRSMSASLQTATSYPTDYPPDWQTQETLVRQTQQAAALTPYPTGRAAGYFPGITPTPLPPAPPPPSTPAGDGVIYDTDDPSLSKAMHFRIANGWVVRVGDRGYTVFAGSDYDADTQGMVIVVVYTINGTELTELPDGGTYSTPRHSGAVQVVGAQGLRLILRSVQGDIFYFDMPGQRFTASLSESVPTVTPWPPAPTITPAFTDDAANAPQDVPGLSPVNTLLRFTINPAGDEDWFRFRLSAPGVIQIYLTNLPANYDLYIYSASYAPRYSGQSTNRGTTAEQVIILDASVDDYYVRVVGVNGAFDPVRPYRLEFVV